MEHELPALDGDALATAVEAALGKSDVTELAIIAEPVRLADAAPLRVQAGCVGVASWALSTLYVSACMRMQRAHDVAGRARAATALLVAVPDDLRAWGARKRAVEMEVRKELALCALILTRAPKAACAWTHRAWILRRVELSDEMLREELAVARGAASRAKANYYAGVHRARLLPELGVDLLTDQLADGRVWLQTHPTDASGWWWHGALLRKMRVTDEGVEDRFVDDMMGRYGGRSEAVRRHAQWWRGRRESAHGAGRRAPMSLVGES